jgi:hypothetical protein
MASCYVGHTSTHLNTEVKQRWARIVLGWETIQMEGEPASCGLGRGVPFHLRKISQNPKRKQIFEVKPSLVKASLV